MIFRPGNGVHLETPFRRWCWCRMEGATVEEENREDNVTTLTVFKRVVPLYGFLFQLSAAAVRVCPPWTANCSPACCLYADYYTDYAYAADAHRLCR